MGTHAATIRLEQGKNEPQIGHCAQCPQWGNGSPHIGFIQKKLYVFIKKEHPQILRGSPGSRFTRVGAVQHQGVHSKLTQKLTKNVVSESLASKPTSLLRSIQKHVTRLGNNLDQATTNIRKVTDGRILINNWLLGFQGLGFIVVFVAVACIWCIL